MLRYVRGRSDSEDPVQSLYSSVYGLSDAQVLELTIAQFLDLESVSFWDRRDLRGVGALRAEVEILRARLRSAGLPTEIDAEIP